MDNRKNRAGVAAGYSISQVSELTGYTADTLRYYEKAGLLVGVKRARGRRVYAESNLRAVKLLDCLKKTGMPLCEIAEFMRLTTGGEATVGKRLAMMRKREAAAKAALREMQDCVDLIAFKVWFYETAARDGLKALADGAAVRERYRRETGRNLAF